MIVILILTKGSRGCGKKHINSLLTSANLKTLDIWTIQEGFPFVLGGINKLAVVLNSSRYEHIVMMRDFLYVVMGFSTVPVPFFLD